MKSMFPRILFFLTGPVPTDEERVASEQFGPNVVFRNASVVPHELNPGAIEEHAGVAGAVPKAYAAAKRAEHAIEEFLRARAQRAFNFGAGGLAPATGTGASADGDGKSGDAKTPAPGLPGAAVTGPTDVATAAAAAGWPATLTRAKGK